MISLSYNLWLEFRSAKHKHSRLGRPAGMLSRHFTANGQPAGIQLENNLLPTRVQ